MNKEIEEIKKEYLIRVKKEISKKSPNRDNSFKGLSENSKKLVEFVKKLNPMFSQVIKDKKIELSEEESQILLDELIPKVHEMIKQYWEK